MGTIIKNTTSAFVDGQQITSDALNNLIDDAILNTTAVSAGTGLTVNASTGVLSMDTSLTGKTLTGGSLNNCPIGASTPSTGAFTTLTASGDVNFDSNTLFVDASTNNVGIGSSAPDKRLVVAGVGSEIVIDDTDATDTPRLRFRESGSTSGSVSTDSGELIFDSGTTERMRIDSSGNVGIGTTSPSNTLHVENTTSSGAYINYDGQSNTEFGLRIESNADGGNFESDFGIGGTALLDLYANSSTVSGGDILVARTQSATPVLLVKGNGNVGIGTTSPAQKLDVNGGARVTGTFFVGTDDTDPNGLLEVYGGGTGQNEGGEIKLRTAADFDSTYNHYFLDTYQDDFRIGRDGIADIHLTSDGNVGIGDPTPSYKLDVNGDFRATGALRDSSGDAGTSGQILSSTGTGTNWINNTGGSSQWVTTGSDIYYTTGNVGINDSTPSYKLDVNGTGRFVNDLTLDEELIHNLGGDGAFPGYSADGTSSHGTRGCVIEDGGVNGSTIYVARRNQWALHLASDTGSQGSPATVVRFADMDEQGSDGAGQVGSITITPSTVALNSTSDYRAKENVVDIADGISRLKELKPYRFNFIRDPNVTVDGFFAHEVSPFVPEAVCGEKDAVDDDGNPVYQGIDQSKLVPLLTAALQEAVAKIEALEARVQTLEG